VVKRRPDRITITNITENYVDMLLADGRMSPEPVCAITSTRSRERLSNLHHRSYACAATPSWSSLYRTKRDTCNGFR
jgi:hypothetical protein